MRIPYSVPKPMVSLVISLVLQGCNLAEIPKAVGYWNGLKTRSPLITQTFVLAAAEGDSARMSAVASDALVQETLVQHRHVGNRFFVEMAESYRPTLTSVYGFGAEVNFTFVVEDFPYRGIAVLEYERGALKLKHFRAPVTID